MSKTVIPVLDTSDIQAAVLRPRPSPYKGEYVLLRIDNAVQGREMLRRIIPHVAPAEEWWVPSIPAWFGIVFPHRGLKALGLPQESLDSFPEEFRQGMAARASILNDIGDNAPANWEQPFGTAAVHVALAIYSSNDNSLDKVLELARQSIMDLSQISVIYRMKFNELPEGRNPFGFKDGLHNPYVEGSSNNPPVGSGASIKPGEIVMGYPDETGETATSPEPEILRRNGTFVVIRKFHTRVAVFRKYLHEVALSPAEEELIAAKIVGRWRSGAPLVLTPNRTTLHWAQIKVAITSSAIQMT